MTQNTITEGTYKKHWRVCPSCAHRKPIYLQRVRCKPDGFGKLWTIGCTKCGLRWEVDVKYADRLPLSVKYYDDGGKW